jgi:hypothetical protein
VKGTYNAFSLIVIAVILFGAAYIGLSAIGKTPSSMKNFVTYLQENTVLFSFLFCFSLGAVVVLRVAQSKRTVKR